jgi:iron complex outermembrane recepter protein
MAHLRRPAFFLIVLAGIPARAGQPPVKSLADASLEELMNLEVTSAAKKPQSLKTTAAAAFVITSEDIRRSGLRSLPELLRLAPGVEVARLDSGNWAISIRGFSGDFSNKLLVLIDGRSVYTEQYGGVYWDVQQLPVEDIERIEVIRGPGAALWGTNAVNGVINILTKSARESHGGLVTAEAGTDGISAVARYGGELGPDAAYRATVYYEGQHQLASSGLPVPLAPSGFHAQSLGFRMDWTPSQRDTLSLAGQAYNSADGRVVFDPTPQDPFPPARFGQETSYQGDATASWQRIVSDRSRFEVRGSFERMDHNELYVPLSYRVAEIDLEHHWQIGSRQELIWGLAYRDARYHLTPTRSFRQPRSDWDADIYAGFFADDVALVRDKLHLIVGAHAGHNEFTGFEYQPTGRLLWTPNRWLTTWAAVSRAVRTPSIADRSNDAAWLAFPITDSLVGVVRSLGTSTFRSEPVISYELGQRAQIGRRISVDGTAFVNVYQRQGAYVAGEPAFVAPPDGTPPYLEYPYYYENARYGRVFGAEVNAAWSPVSRWKLQGGYSWLRERMHWYPGYADSYVGEDPQHQFQVRSWLDLTRTVQLDASAYFYGSTLPYGVPRSLRGDVRLGWRPSESAEISAGVRNALDPQHPEQYSIRYFQSLQARREVYAGVTWRF